MKSPRGDGLLAKAPLILLAGALVVATGEAQAGDPSPAEASAETPAEVAPAEAFDVARRLWEAGDFATALPLFRRALESTHSPNARLYVARCLRDLGRLPEAYDEMRGTVKDAMAKAADEPRYAQTRDTAAAELALLEAKVARVVVVLEHSLAGAPVTVNGAHVAAERFSEPLALMPGEVSIAAHPAGGAAVERVQELAAGSMVTITLGQPAASAPVAESADEPAPVDEPDSGGGFGAVRAVGIGVAAVGVAGFVIFGVGRAQAGDEFATLESECGAGPCTDPAYADVVDSGKQAETMAGIGLGIGIAGVLAGTAMIIFGGPSDDADAAWMPTADGFRVRF